MSSTLSPSLPPITTSPVLSLCPQLPCRSVLVPQHFDSLFLPGSRANQFSESLPYAATKYRCSRLSSPESSSGLSWTQLRAPRISQSHNYIVVVATAQDGTLVSMKKDSTAKKGEKSRKTNIDQSGGAVSTSYWLNSADAWDPIELAPINLSSQDQHGEFDEISCYESGIPFNDAEGFSDMYARPSDVSEEKCGTVREVNCSIEVVSSRERKISGSILVDSSWQHVWEVLTDYERLADFVPSLVRRCPFFSHTCIPSHTDDTIC